MLDLCIFLNTLFYVCESFTWVVVFHKEMMADLLKLELQKATMCVMGIESGSSARVTGSLSLFIETGFLCVALAALDQAGLKLRDRLASPPECGD